MLYNHIFHQRQHSSKKKSVSLFALKCTLTPPFLKCPCPGVTLKSHAPLHVSAVDSAVVPLVSWKKMAVSVVKFSKFLARSAALQRNIAAPAASCHLQKKSCKLSLVIALLMYSFQPRSSALSLSLKGLKVEGEQKRQSCDTLIAVFSCLSIFLLCQATGNAPSLVHVHRKLGSSPECIAYTQTLSV